MASKGDRIREMMKRLRAAAPFATGAVARMALEEIMRAVEDEMSGIRENPDAASTLVTDGRMYPPDDLYEIDSGSALVRTFKQRRHRTSFGENGSLRIVRSDDVVEIDLPGSDGQTVSDLLADKKQRFPDGERL